MTGDVVIRAEGLGKKYVIRRAGGGENYIRLRELMGHNIKGMARSARDLLMGKRRVATAALEDFWALRDVDIDIKRGEVVGIVGRNGAGKSTLLKILSRITDPTEGRVEIRGRVASLLEVGTGFHPELTGRENIFLNGAILGMSRREIRRNFDEIVDFAGVERFLDTPVKRYSSGMYVRLAFAVAAQLEPEILIVDEVLAVGDAEFQRKCLGKMQDVAEGGRTVLFVSHNMAAVERLCSRAVLLEGGRVRMDGQVRNILSDYLSTTDAEVLEHIPQADSSKIAEVKRIVLCDQKGMPLKEVTTADTPGLRIELLVRERRPDLKIAFSLHDALQSPIFASTPGDDGIKQPTEPGLHEFLVVFPGPMLLPLRYSITVSVYSSRGHSFHNCVGALSFDVLPAASQVYSAAPNRVGVIQTLCNWKHTRHEEGPHFLEVQFPAET
jgi:lipopolysaccharide transport system ATP-binding protein